MTVFQVCMLVAAGFFGWIIIDILGAMVKVVVPFLYNIACAFIGVVVAYAGLFP